jgi:putative Holliday junction resolvase
MSMSEPRQILGLDFGQKRIGVARGNTIARLASPLTVIAVDGNEIDKIQQLCEVNECQTIVVGLPRNLNGEETDQTKIVRQFASSLKDRGFSIIWQDESLTSVQAETEQEASGTNSHIDAHAAAIILQDYLDSLR